MVSREKHQVLSFLVSLSKIMMRILANRVQAKTGNWGLGGQSIWVHYYAALQTQIYDKLLVALTALRKMAPFKLSE